MAAASSLYMLATVFICFMKPPQVPMIAFSRDYDEVPTSEEELIETGELEMPVPNPVVEEEQKEKVAAPAEEPFTDETQRASNKHMKENTPKAPNNERSAKNAEPDQISAVYNHNIHEFDKT